MKKCIIKLGVENRNGRIYTYDTVIDTIKSFKEKINLHGGVFGEMFENESYDISLSNAAFIIKDIYINNLDHVIIDINFVKNDLGKLLEENINDYIFISKGRGSIQNNSILNYELITAFVSKKYDTQGNNMDPYHGIYTTKESRRNKVRNILNGNE